jgi:haloacid dehalogenase-like hydrolase
LVQNRAATIRYGREWSVTLCPTDSRKLQEIREFSANLIAKHGYPLHCLTSARCIDVLPKGLGKGIGVARVAEFLHFPLSEIVGIGDSAGDISFLKRVGYSACPNNADHSVKSAVDYVAKTDFASGVIEILRLREGIRARWYNGTAHVLYDDDARERQRWLAGQLPSSAAIARVVRLLGTRLLTVRIDLE